MSTAKILSTYEAISQLTGDMLAAARVQDWDQLIALEKNCAALIERLRRAGAAAGDNAFQLRKAQLIRKVLADDAQIRNFTQPWLEHLQDMLANATRGRLSRAYDGTGTHG